MKGPAVELRIANRDVTALHCALVGISYGRVHLHAERAVASETHVFLKFNQVTLGAIVQYCNPKDSGYRICLSVTGEPDKRRREPRLPIHQHATIMSLGDSTITLEGTLTDLSRSGLRAQICTPLALGTMVCVETHTTIVVGEIRHCVGRTGNYEIGLEITDILTDTKAPDGSTSIMEAFRWKLATLIVGERLSVARKFLR